MDYCGMLMDYCGILMDYYGILMVTNDYIHIVVY